jgi:type II secretory pathway component PulF
MPNAATVRRHVAEVSRRLTALLDESVAPANAVQILVAEGILPAQSNADAAQPLSSAIRSIIPREVAIPRPATRIADYVRACELQGRGDTALRLLGRLKIKRAQGRMSLATIGVEFVLLLLVLTIHALFVMPQFKAMFDAAGKPMPAFTSMVFALIGPSGSMALIGGFGPVMWAIFLVALLVVIWRLWPFLYGPLVRPIDRLLLALPLVGPALRESHGDSISGWLGFAAADASSQRTAVEAAQAWFAGNLLSRECAQVLREVDAGGEITACFAKANGFDSEFRTVVAMPDRADSLAALRARWRVAETLPELRTALSPALVQVVFGMVVAAIVVALYLPIFRLASLM